MPLGDLTVTGSSQGEEAVSICLEPRIDHGATDAPRAPPIFTGSFSSAFRGVCVLNAPEHMCPYGGLPRPSFALMVMTMRLRVLIADDHPIMLSAIRRCLEEVDGFDVVAEATNGSDVLPLIRSTNPDVVLLDLRMPKMDGLTCLDRVRKTHPTVKVIVLSASTDEELISAALSRGASAYIVKSVNPVDFPAVVRQVFEGAVFSAVGLPQEGDQSVAKAMGLTERELVILRAIADGMSNGGIAKKFWIAEQTVKFHLTNVYRKLGVANRTEAAGFAFSHGLVQQPMLRDDDHAIPIRRSG